METMVRLLEENGGNAELADYLAKMLWWGNRMEDLSQWPQFQRDGLRWYLDQAEIVQIIALEEDPIYIVRQFNYDAAGSMTAQDYSYFGGDTISIDYQMNEAMRLEGVNYAGAGYGESYLYDHQNRRVAKQGAGTKIYHYDLAGNLIAEHRPDGSGLREWIYLNGERIALVEVPLGGISIPIDCGGCGSLSRPGENWVAVLLIGGPAFIVFGLARRKRKFMAAGCVMIAGGIYFIPGGEAQSQTATERIYYYHNDHLGTPRVLTDESQTVVWELELSPFGDGWSYIGANSVNNPFRFPGQYDDEYAGLFYNWNRYYMPETSGYNMVDPISSYGYYIYNGGRISLAIPPLSYQAYYPHLFNPYIYPRNAIRQSDRMGLWSGICNELASLCCTKSEDDYNRCRWIVGTAPTYFNKLWCACTATITVVSFYDCPCIGEVECSNDIEVEFEKSYMQENDELEGQISPEEALRRCQEACSKPCDNVRK